MKYLHTMIRTSNLEKTLDFFCYKLGLVEVRRTDNSNGRFTLVFLCAPDDIPQNKVGITSPLIEITYNWPNDKGEIETLNKGRNFGHLAYAVDNIYDYCKELMNKGVTINRPSAPAFSACFESSIASAVELEPVPAITGILPLHSLTAISITFLCSI